MSSISWLDYWGLKFDPFIDFPIGSGEHQQFIVKTRSIQKIEPEIKTILNSPVGVIKPVIGARGSGKSSWLLYLLNNLSSFKEVFIVYVNTFRSISVLKDVGRTLFMEKYVMNDILREILARTRAVCPSLFVKEKWIDDVAKNIVSVPSPAIMPNISADNLFDILRALKGEGYKAFVIAIDELDKLIEEGDPQFEKNLNLKCEFFGTQQGLFQKLASEYNASIYIACDEKIVKPLGRRGLTYLSNRVTIERLNGEEARKIIESRLKMQTSVFPFTDECIELLVSYFQGNARQIIHACRTLMEQATIEGCKIIDAIMVKKIFSKHAFESFKEDFEDLVKIKESSVGAKMLWRLCSKIPDAKERSRTLTYIADVYAQKSPSETPPDWILQMLRDNQYVIWEPSLKKEALDHHVISFFDYWKNKGHSISDFIEWFSFNVYKPLESLSIDEKIESLLKSIRDENINRKINHAYDIYTYILDSCGDNKRVVNESWSMLENIIKAFCLEAGLTGYALSLSEEQEDKHPSREYKERRSLLQLFQKALSIKKIRLTHFGTIHSIRELRNKSEHAGYIPTEEDAKWAKENAKKAFEEILKTWKIGMKISKK